MIKTQIIKEEGKPIAVIMDYQDYLKMKEMAQDRADYAEAIISEKETKSLTPINKIKDLVGNNLGNDN
ncbi:MAG: hypothetical protein HQK96_20000 [Nitrospirae bacterium]|nr:hypothetical protein [Nitrospirota bacterium]